MTIPGEILSKLQNMKLFAEFTSSEIAAFAGLAEFKEAPAGELIVRQDDPGDSMFLIVDGSAVVKHRSGERTVELARIRAGDFFGELALVDEGPRSADVEAVEDSLLLSLSQGSVRALAGVYPSAAFKLLVAVGRVLVDRMRQGNRRYIDSLLVKPD